MVSAVHSVPTGSAGTASVPDRSPSTGGGGQQGGHSGQFVHWRTLRAVKGAGFTLPFLVGFAFLFLIPLVYGVHQSLYTERRSGLGYGATTTEFVGLGNFRRVLSDDVFWGAMLRVFLFAVVQVPVMLLISLTMALLLDQLKSRLTSAFRVVLLVPHMIPGVVATLVWIYLYSPDIGPMTDIGHSLGLHWNFLSAPMMWPSIGNLITWGAIGFNMLIIYGSLQSIDPSLFDAARVDGASEARIARSIKVPHVRGALVLSGMLSIIAMLQLFGEPLLFRSFVPEVVNKDYTPSLMIYNQAFASFNYHYAAALSLVLAAVIAVVSFLFYKFTNRAQP